MPVPKDGKDPKQPASYRPIALTDHLGKLLETIVNDRLVHFLESKGIISKNQSGFRAKRQCMDQLARLVSEVEKSRKLNRQTAAVFLDLEKAYDMLWREGTLAELQSLGVKGQMYNYIMDFLSDRTFQVRVGDTISDRYTQETGTPQGAVLSPTIFNVLINKATKALKKCKHIAVGQYADDSAIWLRAKYAPRRLYSKHKKRYRHVAIQRTKLLIKGPTEAFIFCLESNGFKVNVEKTQCLFFDSDSNPEFEINGKEIRSTDSAKYLGVILDKKLSFNKHIKMLRSRGLKALRILSYMTGKKWGLKAKHRRLLYLNYILPKFTYGEELFDTVAKSNLKLLDAVQNQALRLITKVIKHTKSELLPILARIDPLSVRRIKKKVNLFVRFNQNMNNPARKIFKKLRVEDTSVNRLGRKPSFTNSTIKNVSLCKIETSMISSIPKPIPLWTYEEMDIDISLTNCIDKKTSNSKYMKETSEEHIMKRYSKHYQVYTDASKEGESVGIGIFFEKENKRFSFKTNNHLAITTAELVAIQKVMEMVLSPTFGETAKICICTDSLGACLALKGDPNQTARPDIAHNIIILHHRIMVKGISVSLLWIPSHVDIIGNEIADACANEGRIRAQVDIDIKLGYSELKSLINNTINSEMAQKQYEENNHQKVTHFRQMV